MVTSIRIYAEISGEDLFITIADDGVGISPENEEKIFERGFGKNTGLGLFLVREILSFTGMSIHEKGQEGHGAVFEIRVSKSGWRISEYITPAA
ncbi:MAG TPA: ATP-binding protein [Methanospirillum sp.]|nr:ATP-binding protein [Methanospirillum sp.]